MAEPGPSRSNTMETRLISGSNPGVLDPDQPARLLRLPGSKLSFASFDPRTAVVEKDIPDLRKLSIKEELYRPKHIVIETTSAGESFWRFVPKARTEEGVEHEGSWPRLVEICGELFKMSQDQWDIYKLDPAYDCLVRAYPKISVISRAPKVHIDVTLQNGSSKRPMNATPSPQNPNPPPTTSKKPRNRLQTPDLDEDTSDEEEVEMIVDGEKQSRTQSVPARERAKKFREKVEQNRKLRREKIARATARDKQDVVDMEDIDIFAGAEDVPTTRATGTIPKRKASSTFQSLDPSQDGTEDQVNDEGYHKSGRKRHRTVSPVSMRRGIEEKRLEREKKKRSKLEERLHDWRQQRNQAFMNDIFSHVPQPQSNAPGHENEEQESDDEGFHDDEEAAHQAAIAESRRKLAELEADRPLWEQEAKKRVERERVEEEQRRARVIERKRAEEQEAEAEKRRKQDEAEMEEAMKRKEQEQAARRAQEKRQRQQRERWTFGPWTHQRALERYRALSESFDGTKFSPEEPLTFEVVPWPVLHPPLRFTVEDIDWEGVENFFEAVKPHMRAQDYKTFVETSHRRFHPDRWRSRRLLTSIFDEAERGCLEVAANTVAQALTPLWKEIKG